MSAGGVTPIFQISGVKDPRGKGPLLRAIKKLGGIYMGGPVYADNITHLVVSRPLPSEKFLAACAGGKWIVTPKYLLDCCKCDKWLPEEPYEVSVSAVRTWRERISRGAVSGAFHDWVVLLEMENQTKRDIICRVLKAGKATVYLKRPTVGSITHVISRHTSKEPMDEDVLSISMHSLAFHLFRKSLVCLQWPINRRYPSKSGNLDDMDTSSENVIEELDKVRDTPGTMVIPELQKRLEDYMLSVEKLKQRSRLLYPQYQSFYLSSPTYERPRPELKNVESLLDCGFFSQALEELQTSLYAGVCPPSQFVNSLLEYALHGDAKPYFLCMFGTLFHNILSNNSPCGSLAYVKYYQQILQCPQCKQGLWSLLSTSIRFCMSNTSTCHSLPSSASQELINFHHDLQEFILRLFQVELHAMNSGLTSSASAWSTVLGSTFWTVWERSMLSSKAVLQLVELLVEVCHWVYSCTQEEVVLRQQLVLRVQELVEVVLEVWSQAHNVLNRPLVEKSLQELGKHIAVLGLNQDDAPGFLMDLIQGMRCSSLRMVTADTLFCLICRRNCVSTGVENLSLRKIVSTYLKALGSLGRRRRSTLDPLPWPRSEPNHTSCASQKTGLGSNGHVLTQGPGKENAPRGSNRVNLAGETLLHRACKRDQVNTVLSLLASPGTDVNVKDYAGWTPLHEACHHGSIECVRALLQNPAIDVTSQVDGISPLHSALLSGHVHIAKMLLQYGGSSLLEISDNFDRTPLDLVLTATQREELLLAAENEINPSEGIESDVHNLDLVETCSCLLVSLLIDYQKERDLPSAGVGYNPLSLQLPPWLTQALLDHATTSSTGSWPNARARQLVQDLETLVTMGCYIDALSPSLRLCKGPHTQVLLKLLEVLQESGQQLLLSEGGNGQIPR